jgi:hypothetical protein
MRRLLLALVLCTCGPDVSLSGSLEQLIPLDVSGVSIYRNDEGLQVTYTRSRGLFLDIVMRMTVSLTGLAPGAKAVNLVGDWRPGNPRVTFAHAPGGEPVRLLPKVKRGDLALTEGGGVGVLTKGNFSVVFEDTGGDFGTGRSLSGRFLGTAQDAGFGDIP